MSRRGARRAVDDAPVVKLINAILTDAVKRGASDIHFECFEHELRVRYRIDGALSGSDEAADEAQGGARSRASRSWRSSTSPSAACRRTAASS